MLSSNRRAQQRLDVWPGYVDALASLLMVVIFLLMIFSVAQLFLSQTLDQKDTELDALNSRIAEISNLLNLRTNENKELQEVLEVVSSEVADLEQETQQQNQRIALLSNNIDQLTERESALAQNRDELNRTLTEKQTELASAQALNSQQEDQIRTLNLQITLLRRQLEQIANALLAAEENASEKAQQLKNLSQRLNLALAQRVNELEQYRSEFFATLKTALKDIDGVVIDGDRFILPSELLFGVGQATLGEQGRSEINKLANTLSTIAEKIPENVPWILRVDGHTDAQPISGPRFSSNWALSVARAVSVVEQLEARGIAPKHLAATGFGPNYPLAEGNDAASYRKNRRIEFKLTNR